MKDFLTKDGRKFVIRIPDEGDAAGIIAYSKILFASTDQVLTTPEEYTITPEGEKEWLNDFKRNPNALVVIAESNQQIIGLLFFVPQTKIKVAHTGEFGVSVHPAYQTIGVGRALIECLVQWVNSNPQIKKVYLQVFASNIKAIELYKRLGFIEEGRHVRAIRQMDGTYVDVIQMYRIFSL